MGRTFKKVPKVKYTKRTVSFVVSEEMYEHLTNKKVQRPEPFSKKSQSCG